MYKYADPHIICSLILVQCSLCYSLRILVCADPTLHKSTSYPYAKHGYTKASKPVVLKLGI